MKTLEELTPDELRAENRRMNQQMDLYRRREPVQVQYNEAIARKREVQDELSRRGEVVGIRHAAAIEAAGPGPRPITNMLPKKLASGQFAMGQADQKRLEELELENARLKAAQKEQGNG